MNLTISYEISNPRPFTFTMPDNSTSIRIRHTLKQIAGVEDARFPELPFQLKRKHVNQLRGASILAQNLIIPDPFKVLAVEQSGMPTLEGNRLISQ